jgi:hypothetical protein
LTGNCSAQADTPQNDPVQFFVSDHQIGDVLTWIAGKHILKAGIDISLDQFNPPFCNNPCAR